MAKLGKVSARTTPAFGAAAFDRALNECLGRRQFGPAEHKAVIEYFGFEPPRCVYCGNPEAARWDHIVSVRDGGETVLGNMVPACAQCDNEKNKSAFDVWMLSPALAFRGVTDAAERLQRIREYMLEFGYQPATLQERLSDAEFQELVKIRKEIKSLQENCDALILSYRQRTGSW